MICPTPTAVRSCWDGLVPSLARFWRPRPMLQTRAPSSPRPLCGWMLFCHRRRPSTGALPLPPLGVRRPLSPVPRWEHCAASKGGLLARPAAARHFKTTGARWSLPSVGPGTRRSVSTLSSKSEEFDRLRVECGESSKPVQYGELAEEVRFVSLSPRLSSLWVRRVPALFRRCAA
jgi:hypothetical protein